MAAILLVNMVDAADDDYVDESHFDYDNDSVTCWDGLVNCMENFLDEKKDSIKMMMINMLISPQH